MHKSLGKIIIASIILCTLLVALFSSSAFAKANLSAPHSSFTASTAHTASCSLVLLDFVHIYDQVTGVEIGNIFFSGDGCGDVKATVSAYTSGHINHNQLFNPSNPNTPIVDAGGSSDTGWIHTNGTCLYAVGIVQNLSAGYWGKGQTKCWTGWE